MVWPKKVKLVRGIVKSPVTQVAEVAVNKRSIKGIVLWRAAGKARSTVPMSMVSNAEQKIIKAGENRASRLLIMIIIPYFLLILL